MAKGQDSTQHTLKADQEQPKRSQLINLQRRKKDFVRTGLTLS